MEPTRFWGNLGNVASAGAGVAATVLPGPWGPIVSAGLGVLALVFTEINRSKVTPNSAAVVVDLVKKIEAANAPK